MMLRRLRAPWLALVLITAAMSCAPDARNDGALPFEPVVEQADADAAGQQYTYILERTDLSLPLSISGLIGLLGGVLDLGDHSLLVPRGAVTLPTLFTMIRIPNGRIEVELLAVRELLFRILNIGEGGFNKPVTVELSYANAINVTDPSKLKILRLKPNGQHELMPSVVDTVNKTVRAQLDHFSRYCMVQD